MLLSSSIGTVCAANTGGRRRKNSLQAVGPLTPKRIKSLLQIATVRMYYPVALHLFTVELIALLSFVIFRRANCGVIVYYKQDMRYNYMQNIGIGSFIFE